MYITIVIYLIFTLYTFYHFYFTIVFQTNCINWFHIFMSVEWWICNSSTGEKCIELSTGLIFSSPLCNLLLTLTFE